MKKILIILSVVASSLLATTNVIKIENKNIDKLITDDKKCNELIIKNANVSNSKLFCKKITIQNSVLEGTITTAQNSLTFDNVTVKNTVMKDKAHLVACLDCQKRNYNIFNSHFENNNVSSSLIYDFGDSLILKDVVSKNNRVHTLIFKMNNETMYDIWNGNKVSEMYPDNQKQYEKDLLDGIIDQSEFNNNHSVISNFKSIGDIATYGIYNVKTWDYYTKNSYITKRTTREIFTGVSYQKTLMRIILPDFIFLENSDFSQSHFEKFAVAGENIFLHHSKIGSNIFFTNSIQGYNNVFTNGKIITGINELMAVSSYNFKTKNYLINSAFYNYTFEKEDDIIAINSITNSAINSIDTIYEPDIYKFYKYIEKSNNCGIYPYDYLSLEFAQYGFPYMNKFINTRYLGRDKNIVKNFSNNVNDKCEYELEIFKSRRSAELKKSSFKTLSKDLQKLEDLEDKQERVIRTNKKEEKVSSFSDVGDIPNTNNLLDELSDF